MSFPSRSHWRMLECVCIYFVLCDGLAIWFWEAHGQRGKAVAFALAVVVAVLVGTLAHFCAEDSDD